MPRTCVILTPYFPPATLAGVHRARHLAKHLPSFGWHPIILRAHERHYTERLDPTLAALIPTTVEQVRTGAIAATLTRRVGVGDIGLRSYFPFRAALTALGKTRKIDAVLITGSPFYPMLLSRYVRESLQIPVILDFQDPWFSANGALRPRWSKGGLSHRLAFALEPHVLRYADFVTSVSEVQNLEMMARYPWLDSARMASIPIGGDPDDFEALRAAPPINPIHRLDPGKINISYVGSVWPRAVPLVRSLLRSAGRLVAEQPDLAGNLRLNFVGTSSQSEPRGSGPVMAVAREEGVAHLVSETARRVPYLEALSILANSQAILMVGSDEPHYTASKIFSCLMSGRPYLSLFHAASSAHAILSAAGGGRCFSIGGLEDLAGLEPGIAAGLGDLCAQPESFGRADAAAYEAFTARRVAGAFVGVFEAVARA